MKGEEGRFRSRSSLFLDRVSLVFFLFGSSRNSDSKFGELDERRKRRKSESI